MIISPHARERMTQRGIPRCSILAALAHGAKSETAEGRVKHVLEAVGVVTAGNIVVTTWVERCGKASNPKRRIRKARQYFKAINRENSMNSGGVY